MTNLEQFENKHFNQEALSVYDTTVRMSSKLMKRVGLKGGDYLKFAIDREDLTIGVSIVAEQIRGLSYKVGSQGYCSVRIGDKMPNGRYIYQNKVGEVLIFKK